jgi:hypothetical protein
MKLCIEGDIYFIPKFYILETGTVKLSIEIGLTDVHFTPCQSTCLLWWKPDLRLPSPRLGPLLLPPFLGPSSSLVSKTTSTLHLATPIFWTSPRVQLFGLLASHSSHESRTLLLSIGLLRRSSSHKHAAPSRRPLPLLFTR